jgi:adenylate cyclase
MVGDTVNLAFRIQGLNKEFGTDLLISAITVERLVDDMDIEVEKLPVTTVKGRRNPVGVYNLVQAL